MVPSQCKIFGLLIASVFSAPSCKEAYNPKTESENSILVVEPSHVDIGKINEGGSKIGEVAVLNKSRYPVAVERVTASCGCTSAKVADDVIPPGGRSTLSAELSPQGRRGAFGSTVNIAWSEQVPDAPRTGEVKATFQADGLYVANISPGYVDFGSVGIEASPPEQTLSLSRGTQEIAFVEVGVENDSPAIETTVEKINDDEWLTSIKLVPGGLPAGPLRVPITFVFRDIQGSELHRHELSVRGDIKGLVSVKPKSLFFGALAAGTDKKGAIIFNVPRGKTAEIKSIRVEPDNGCLTLKSIKPQQNESENAIEYFLQTTGKSGDLSGRIFVTFEDQSLGKISMPFILHVKE